PGQDAAARGRAPVGGGRAQPAAGPARAAPRPVRAVREERLPGRLRPVLPVPGPAPARGRRAAGRHRAARAGRHADHRPHRRVPRHRGRGAPGHPLRLREHRAGRARPVPAELLARHHADPALRRRAALAPHLRLRELASSHPARGDAGRLPDGAGGAADPLEHAGDPRSRVHPHRPGQGSGRARGDLAARAAQRGGAAAHRARAADRHPARRRGHHRVGVRVARHGQARGRRDLLPRLPGGADRADSLRHHLRGHQPPSRPALYRDRTADPLLVSLARPDDTSRAGRLSPIALVGAALLVIVALASVLAPLLVSSDPLKPSFSRRLARPWGLGGTPAHVLGTDNLGRDILARLLHGGRTSLALAATSVVLAAAAGILVGLVAGSGGERIDAVLMRAADVQLAFPVIMLAIAIVAVVGTSPAALVGVLALSGWVLYARTVRASVLTIRRLEYVEAAYTLG